jgi:ankyrin repeat protein
MDLRVTIQESLDNGLHANEIEIDDIAALQVAARYGRVDCVRLLIEHGVDINMQNVEDGTTALMEACSARPATSGHMECVHVLLENGADPNVQDYYEDGTALTRNAYSGCLEYVCILISYGANIALRNKYEGTALTIAAMRGHDEFVRLLLESGADACIDDDSYDDECSTALMKAAQYGRDDCVRMLLEHGADTDLQNIYGFTALMQAVKFGRNNCVRMLLEHGADLAPKLLEWGYTALMIADITEREDCIIMIADELKKRKARREYNQFIERLNERMERVARERAEHIGRVERAAITIQKIFRKHMVFVRMGNPGHPWCQARLLAEWCKMN